MILVLDVILAYRGSQERSNIKHYTYLIYIYKRLLPLGSGSSPGSNSAVWNLARPRSGIEGRREIVDMATGEIQEKFSIINMH